MVVFAAFMRSVVLADLLSDLLDAHDVASLVAIRERPFLLITVRMPGFHFQSAACQDLQCMFCLYHIVCKSLGLVIQFTACCVQASVPRRVVIVQATRQYFQHICPCRHAVCI